MDDKDRLLSDDAEYRFSETEDVRSDAVNFHYENSEVHQGKAGWHDLLAVAMKRLQQIGWRRLLLPGSMMIAVLLLYLSFNLWGARRERMLEQQKIAAHNEAALVSQQNLAGSQLNELSGSPRERLGGGLGSDMDALRRDLQRQVDVLTRQLAENRDQLGTLERSVAEVQQELGQATRKLDQFFGATHAVLSEVVAQLRVAEKGKVKSKAPVKVRYTVRSIIPGRVWLQAEGGKSVTLKVGDRLAGYGEVKAISPGQGMVLMSDGSVIQYGVNDA